MCDKETLDAVEIERYAKQMMAKKKYYGIHCRDEETLDAAEIERYIEDVMFRHEEVMKD